MKKIKYNIIYIIAMVVSLQFFACQQKESNYVKIEPAQIDHIDNSEITKLTLTEKAAERPGGNRQRNPGTSDHPGKAA